MSSADISRVLSEMRALHARVSGLPEQRQDVGGTSAGDFAAMMRSSVDKVSQMQNEAQALSTAYEMGDKSVDLTKVMVEVQKAGIAFRAMTEVRNKLIDAYQQVMNMQV